MTDKDNSWKLVPIEPTKEMWMAVDKLDDQMAAGNYDGKGCSIEQAWACLVDAAPAAPATGHQFADPRNMVVSVALTDEQIVIAGMNHFSRCEVPEAMLSYIAAVRECLALAAPAAPAPIYQYQTGDGSWIDQTRQSHLNNQEHAADKTRIVYAAPAQGANDAWDMKRLDFLLEDGAIIDTITNGEGEKRYHLYWPALDESQRAWYCTPRAAIDAQMAAMFDGSAENTAAIAADGAGNGGEVRA